MSYAEQYLLALLALIGVVAVWQNYKRHKAEMREQYVTEALIALARKEATITLKNNQIVVTKHGANHEASQQN